MSLVVTCVRNLYTHVKNLVPYMTQNTVLFMWPKHHQLVAQEKIKNNDDVVRTLTAQAHMRGVYNHKYGSIL